MMEAIRWAQEALIILACACACLFAVLGTVGLYRFPDVYSRLQASSVAGTTAVFTAFIAALLTAPDFAVAFRVLLVIVFFMVSSPTTTHIIARYAWRSGIDPWNPRADG